MLSAHVRNRGTRRDGSTKWQARFREPNQTGKWVEKTFRRKTDADRWLRRELASIDEGAWPGAQRRTGATFAEAADEWLRWLEHDQSVKPSTLCDHKLTVERYLKPAFGAQQIEKVTTKQIERWRDTVTPAKGKPLAPRTRNKLVIAVHGVFERARKVYGLRSNPAAEVERLAERSRAALDVFSPDEVWALVRTAEAGKHRSTRTPAGGIHVKQTAEQQRGAEDATDAAIYLTAAFTGLRLGELRALRWREVDFLGQTLRVVHSYAAGELTLPKWNKIRAVPLVDEVATTLARLGQRDRFTGDDDLVFTVDGGYIDESALRRRYKRALTAAGLRSLRFHDLRHTFGSLAINRASIVQVQAWMGHADIRTTQGYLHFKSRGDEATLLAGAFTSSETPLSSGVI